MAPKPGGKGDNFAITTDDQWKLELPSMTCNDPFRKGVEKQAHAVVRTAAAKLQNVVIHYFMFSGTVDLL